MLTGQQLQEAKTLKNEFYRSIEKVILPENLQKLNERINIFIGGCFEKGVGHTFYAQAHAHNYTKDKLFGCICFLSIKRIGRYNIVQNDNGYCDIIITKPSQTLLHEIAHILTPNHGHDKKWLDKYIELGATKGKIKYYKDRFKGCN